MELVAFTWDYPIYALAARETVTIKDGQAVLDDAIRFSAPALLLGTIQVLALFTDTDAAQVFHKQASPNRDLVLFNVPDAQSFYRLLERVAPVYSFVIFDPNAEKQTGQLVASQELLRRVGQSLDRPIDRGDQ